MALSDACFEFLTAISRAAHKLADDAHYYAAPDYPLQYGPEVDALRRAAWIVGEHPYDVQAVSRLADLASKVQRYLDTPPNSDRSAERKAEVIELVRLLQNELSREEAEAVPSVVDNVVTA